MDYFKLGRVGKEDQIRKKLDYSLKNKDDFPLDCLPDVLQETLKEVHSQVKSPIGIIASSMLSSMSIACQGAFNIKSQSGDFYPASIYTMTIAESGERKTGTDKVFNKQIIDYIESRAEFYKNQKKDYNTKKYLLKLEESVYSREIKKRLAENDCISDIKENLEKLKKEEEGINPPLEMKLLYSDVTSESLLWNMAKKWPCAALSSSEGVNILNGRAGQKIGLLNELWDAPRSFTVDRKTSESIELKNPRLTISIMVQPKVFEDFLVKDNFLAINIGLLSRFLISMPTSTQGERYISENDKICEILNFKSYLNYWLKKSEERILDNKPYEVFNLSKDAKKQYLNILNYIEEQISENGYLSKERALASKLGNNILRIAGLIQAFDDKINIISEKNLCCAYEIACWYTQQYLKIMSNFSKDLSADDMGNILLSWLEERREGSESYFNVTYIYRSAPNAIRGKEKVQIAIENLEQRGFIKHNRNQRPMNIYLQRRGPDFLSTSQQGFTPGWSGV